jgi:integrase
MDEVRQLLASVADVHGYPTRLIVHLLYACGLRVTEPLNFRIKDLDLAQSRFHVHQAKGKKGRVVRFPDCLLAPLAKQLEIAKASAATDRAQGIPVALPDLLAKKYPYAAHAERWAWLFPSRTTCRHPRTRQIVRWRYTGVPSCKLFCRKADKCVRADCLVMMGRKASTKVGTCNKRRQ